MASVSIQPPLPPGFVDCIANVQGDMVAEVGGIGKAALAKLNPKPFSFFIFSSSKSCGSVGELDQCPKLTPAGA